jgi:hypothetical protein
MQRSLAVTGVTCVALLLAGGHVVGSQGAPDTAQLDTALATLERGRYAEAAALLQDAQTGLKNASAPDLQTLTSLTALAAVEVHLRGGTEGWTARIENELERLIDAIKTRAIPDEDHLRTLEVASSVSQLVGTPHARRIAESWPELDGSSQPQDVVARLRSQAAGFVVLGLRNQARERLLEALELHEERLHDDTPGLVEILTDLAFIEDSSERAHAYLERALAAARTEPRPSAHAVIALGQLIVIMAERQRPLTPSIVEESLAYRDRVLNMAPASTDASRFRRSLEAFNTAIEIYSAKDMALRGTMLMSAQPTVEHGQSLLNLTIALGALGGPESPFVEAWLRELAKYLRYFGHHEESQALESRANSIERR